MSPAAIVKAAVLAGLDIIALTDHNHTGHALLVRKLAAREGLYVFLGAEVTTREEVHCLALFDSSVQIGAFQDYLDTFLPPIPNHPDFFGDQVIIGEEEEIVAELPYLLTNGIDQSINDVEQMVHKLGGLFIPAHVDRPVNGLYSQLGFFPEGLQVDAVELSRFTSARQMNALHPELEPYTFIQSSDAHIPGDIGRAATQIMMGSPGLEELSRAFAGEGERRVILL